MAKAEKKPLYAYLAKFNPSFDGRFVMPIPLMNIINGGRHANWATDLPCWAAIGRRRSTSSR